MINQFYISVQDVLNKNQMGKISPSEFNSFVNDSINKIQSNLFADFRKLSYRNSKFQATSNYGNESFHLQQAIEYWVENADVNVDKNGYLKLPDDYYADNAVFGKKSEYAKVDYGDFVRLSNSRRMKPSNCNAIHTITNGSIKVSPIPTDTVHLVYYRKPKLAKWTYDIDDENIVFNPSANDFQDIDIHPIMYDKLFTEVLLKCGVNLREADIKDYITLMKQEEQINKQ